MRTRLASLWCQNVAQTSCRSAGIGSAKLSHDFAQVAADLRLTAKLERKPGLLLNTARELIEKKLDLPTDELLVSLADWLSHVATPHGQSPIPAAAGLAHVSGNVYFALPLPLPISGSCVAERQLEPEQVLLASLFSHGEIGLDAFATAQGRQPSSASGDCLAEVVTFKRLYAVHPQNLKQQKQQASKRIEDRQLVEATVAKPVRRSVFKGHPLAKDIFGSGPESSFGDCLQHSNFGHLDLTGNSISEYHESLARIAATRAYRPNEPSSSSTENALAGIALRTKTGSLFAGSSIGARRKAGTISPLGTALASMYANGVDVAEVISAKWTATDLSNPEAKRLCEIDATWLSELAPEANFEEISYASGQ